MRRWREYAKNQRLPRARKPRNERRGRVRATRARCLRTATATITAETTIILWVVGVTRVLTCACHARTRCTRVPT
jgi:hypothetical protein